MGSSPKSLSSKYPSDGMVDILRLERSAERHRGSSPLLGTKFNLKKLLNYLVVSNIFTTFVLSNTTPHGVMVSTSGSNPFGLRSSRSGETKL